ncbi:MAG: endonuclease III [Prevotellaceae bacterium]|nr:endonuclease III [Prevotellaceae bacterium]
MNKKERYARFIAYFEKAMPEAETELHYATPFQLLCAVILSAQCTDKRVNLITPALFAAFPTSEEMAKATKEDVLEYVRSVSYPNSKAEHLVQMSRMLVEKHGGEVPSDFDALVALPGVGRKTANVMLSVAFNQTAMAVDTHVFRLSHRIGLVTDKCTTPFAVEKELVKNIPADIIPRAHHWLILHGRYVCKSQRPNCTGCGLTDFCKYYSNKKT